MAKGILALLPSTDLPETFFLRGSSSTLVRDLLQTLEFQTLFPSTFENTCLRRRPEAAHSLHSNPRTQLHQVLRSWHPHLRLFHLWILGLIRSEVTLTPLNNTRCAYSGITPTAIPFSRSSDSGNELRSPTFAGRFFTSEPPGKPQMLCTTTQILPIRVYTCSYSRCYPHTQGTHAQPYVFNYSKQLRRYPRVLKYLI